MLCELTLVNNKYLIFGEMLMSKLARRNSSTLSGPNILFWNQARQIVHVKSKMEFKIVNNLLHVIYVFVATSISNGFRR